MGTPTKHHFIHKLGDGRKQGVGQDANISLAALYVTGHSGTNLTVPVTLSVQDPVATITLLGISFEKPLCSFLRNLHEDVSCSVIYSSEELGLN